MKRILLSLMIGIVAVLSAPLALADGIEHELFALELSAGEAQLVEAPFSFQAFALSEVEGVQVRFLRQGEWSEWQELGLEEENIAGSELTFIHRAEAFSLRSEADLNVQATIMNLREVDQVASINPIGLDDPTAYFGESLPSGGSVQIISRREWGADETLRTYNPDDVEDDNGSSSNPCEPIEVAYPGQYQMKNKVVYFDQQGRNLIWPQRYSRQVKKIVIHHSAKTVEDLNEDGRVDSRDYRLAVQATYTYHTVSRGWGDIGYHFLVDPDGNVYEGRAGGKDVIGAHVLCQNSNTIGIAVLGNYETDRLPVRTFNGLVNVTKYAADLYNINPEGKSAFRGEVMPHIVTHADVGELTSSHIGRGATACPGKFLKREMKQLRQVVANGGIKPNVGYNLVKKESRLKIDPLQDFVLPVTLKNTGEQMWTSVAFAQRRQEVYDNSSILVSSGQEYAFEIPLTGSFDAGKKELDLQVTINGQKMNQSLDLSYIVNRPSYRYELLAFEGAEHSLLVGEERPITMTLKNTSNFPWLNTGADQVKIHEVRHRGANIAMVPNGLSLFLSESVPVGEEITLTAMLPVQRQEGVLDMELVPVFGRNKGLKGKKMVIRLDVEEPRFVADVNLAERTTRLTKGFEETVNLQVTNKGNFDWEEGMVWIRFGGEKMLIGEALARGKSVQLPVTLQAGYFDRLMMVTGDLGIEELPDSLSSRRLQRSSASFELPVRTSGKVSFTAEKIGELESFIPNVKGEYQVEVELKNTGSVPWYRDGEQQIALEVQQRPDFAHTSWEKRRFAGFLKQELVMPGELGTFTLTLRVKNTLRRSTFDEFLPVVAGKRVKVRGGKIRFGVEGKLPEKPEKDETPADAAPSADAGPTVPPMRVLLMDVDEPVLEVSSSGAFVVWDSKTVQIRSFAGGEVFSVSEDEVRDGTVFRMRAKEVDHFRFVNWHRVRAFGNNLDDNAFREVLEFRWDADEGKMIAINELPLEQYMKGIAEVPETADQPQEKRKVIAVLARSYALHYLISGYEKFPGKPYNAADSPAIFQKYNGYNFELRSPLWQQAVEDTAGEVVLLNTNIVQGISNKEQVLRAAYFSCTDGERTKSWDEVWPDNEYFQRFGAVFQSVADPLGDDPTREGSTACGHQVGLSGYGATQKAAQGEGYREIIGHYYTGAEVGRWE